MLSYATEPEIDSRDLWEADESDWQIIEFMRIQSEVGQLDRCDKQALLEQLCRDLFQSSEPVSSEAPW